jgi:uncharacterized protein
LVVLGDLFHARSSLSVDVRASLEGFFGRHAALQIVLVRGNHDVHVGALPAAWPIQVVEPGTSIERVVLCHHPSEFRPGLIW